MADTETDKPITAIQALERPDMAKRAESLINPLLAVRLKPTCDLLRNKATRQEALSQVLHETYLVATRRGDEKRESDPLMTLEEAIKRSNQ